MDGVTRTAIWILFGLNLAIGGFSLLVGVASVADHGVHVGQLIWAMGAIEQDRAL